MRFEVRARLCFSNALIEFISWKLLGEPGASEELAAKSLRLAFAANQYVAVVLTCAEVFLEVITGAKEIRNARCAHGHLQHACGLQVATKERKILFARRRPNARCTCVRSIQTSRAQLQASLSRTFTTVRLKLACGCPLDVWIAAVVPWSWACLQVVISGERAQGLHADVVL